MFAFWRNVKTVDGQLQDPQTPPKVNEMLTEKLTKDPSKLVQTFTKTSQAHLYVSQLTKEAVQMVMEVHRDVLQNPDNHTGDPTFESDSLELVTRFLGRKHKFTFGARSSYVSDFRMDITLESACNYQLGERNEDLDEFKWCLVCKISRPDMKCKTHSQFNRFYYLGGIEAFKTRSVFDGPGAEHGRDAFANIPEDFQDWEREMLKTGSPLYNAFTEIMYKFGHIGPCKYCRSGVAYNSMVCDECASKWSWTGCKCCGDMLGMMTDSGVHENCE